MARWVKCCIDKLLRVFNMKKSLHFSLFAFACACGPKKGQGADDENATPSIVEKTLPDGLILQEVDLNTDGQPEIYNYYRERTDAPRL